jgi:N-acetylmuramic acid 6-phosphate etherase
MPDLSPEPSPAQPLTEQRHSASEHLDELSTFDLMRVIHEADAAIPAAIAPEIPAIARATDEIAERMDRGGRMFYLGAGTSGRLGVLDASECPPTFNVSPDLVQGIIAGGDYALRHAIEGAEDDAAGGIADLKAHGFGREDALVGVAASGHTPYVLGAIPWARRLGALTVGLSCVPASPIALAADIAITPAVGPEVVTGSTRMRAGTATKLVLNMLSTAVMIRRGLVYGNLMVNVQPTNAKLRDRAVRIVADLTRLPRPEAAALLARAGAVKSAVLMHALGLTREQAEARLEECGGRLRQALQHS